MRLGRSAKVRTGRGLGHELGTGSLSQGVEVKIEM